MPYKVKGSILYHDPNNDGHWMIKQRCESHENAIAAMQLIQMKKHGIVPRGGWRNQRTRRGLKR